MSGPSIDSPPALRLTRTFAAPRERVFRAWTEPEALKKWFRVAEGYATPIAEVDLRVGGRYRLGMQPPGSSSMRIVGGVYQEVQPPARLVFTWRWEGAGQGEPETVVTVEFHSRREGTQVVLTHARLPDAAARDLHAEGWRGCLDGLTAYISA